VAEIMRTGELVTLVREGATTREVVLAMNGTKGRPGAAMILDHKDRLAGIFTDGDLARNLQLGLEFLNRPVDEVMNRSPLTIGPDRLASEAHHLLRERRVDQLPVVDDESRPVGLLDVQDLLAAGIL
jgi:arabinose-5-phosphate isomerase